jgi:hypothetical protein
MFIMNYCDEPRDNIYWNKLKCLPKVAIVKHPNYGIKSVQALSDYVSYLSLHEYGGLYLDIDTLSIEPIWDMLPDGYDLAAGIGRVDPNGNLVTVSVGIMLSRKNCKILTDVISEAISIDRSGIIFNQLGGPLLSKYFIKNISICYPINRKYLYPWPYTESKRYWEDSPPPSDMRIYHYYGGRTRANALSVNAEYVHDMYHYVVDKIFGSWDFAMKEAM